MTEFRFAVAVPVEPVMHESIDSSSTYQLPAGRFGAFDVSREGPLYVLKLECVASSPSEAMRSGLGTVEDLLRILAAANDAFRVRAAGITAENLGAIDAPADLTNPQSGTVQIDGTVFVQGHLGTIKLKGSLQAEAKAVEARDGWPDYLQDALELNYLPVISERPLTKWLLETIALERLAGGRLGPRSTHVTDRLKASDRRALRQRLTAMFEEAGVVEPELGRLVGRVFTTEDESAPSHITRYLAAVKVEVDPAEVSAWWTRRGRQAHGSTEPVDPSALSRLISRTQAALARELAASAE